MPTIDRKPERPKPIEAASNLLVRGSHSNKAHAATIIRDLLMLAAAYRQLADGMVIEKTRETITRLSYLLD